MITHSRETYQRTNIMRWDRGIFNGSTELLLLASIPMRATNPRITQFSGYPGSSQTCLFGKIVKHGFWVKHLMCKWDMFHSIVFDQRKATCDPNHFIVDSHLYVWWSFGNHQWLAGIFTILIIYIHVILNVFPYNSFIVLRCRYS